MDSKQPPAEAEQDDVNALETPENEVGSLETSEGGGQQTIDATSSSGSAAQAPPPKPPKKGGVKHILQRFNVYLLLFAFILLIAGVIIIIAYFQSKKASTTSTLKTQELTQATLNQVANSDASVGSSQQVLNVQSSAVFAGKVLVRQNLEVAGSLQIGGTVGLTDLTVSGSTQLGQTQISKNLSVSGDTAVQGAATINKGLQVSGTANFSGPLSAPQITTSSFNLNSDLTLTRHIIAGGGNPGRSNGPALGAGGTASVSGSDTAGSVSINTGSSPPAGCFVTINFTQKYNNTPHVLLTPVGPGAGGLPYYVTRTTTSFSICNAASPPSGTSFGFDYFVTG
jgi:cytoskeletal protein CcmA (bactofilin family)